MEYIIIVIAISILFEAVDGLVNESDYEKWRNLL